jgi:CheY-like chemotaxis protein
MHPGQTTSDLGGEPSTPIDSEMFVLARTPSGSRKSASREKVRRNRAAASKDTILLFGRMRELALYRAEVLKTRGFGVITPETKADAIAAIEEANFDVAVFSYTLSSDTVEELTELLRQKCPGCPLITISDTGNIDPRLRPERTVLANEGPAALIKALRQVLQRH